MRGGLTRRTILASAVVSLDVTAERVAPELEATAYFVVAEALTNTIPVYAA